KTVAVDAARQPDSVLRPDRGAAGSGMRDGHDVAEAARITLRDRVTCGDLLLENLQFLEQDRRLHGVEPSRQPEPDVVIFVRTLTMDADAAQDFGKAGIIGKDRAAVAETAERFCGKETGGGSDTERAKAAALV